MDSNFFIILAVLAVLFFIFYPRKKNYSNDASNDLSDMEKEYNELVDLADNEELKLKKAKLAIKIMEDEYDGNYEDELLPRAEKMYEEVKQLGDSDKLKALRADLASAIISFYSSVPTEEHAVRVEEIYQETKAYLADDKKLRIKTASLAAPLISFYEIMRVATDEQNAYPENIAKAENIYNEIKSFGAYEEIKNDLSAATLPLLDLYGGIDKPDQSLVKKAEQIYNEFFGENATSPKQITKYAQSLIKKIQKKYASSVSYEIPKPPTK